MASIKRGDTRPWTIKVGAQGLTAVALATAVSITVRATPAVTGIGTAFSGAGTISATDPFTVVFTPSSGNVNQVAVFRVDVAVVYADGVTRETFPANDYLDLTILG